MSNLLVKISGDFISNETVKSELLKEAEKYNSVVLIHGAGRQFSEISKERICFEGRNRVASQEQLMRFYHSPQQEIRDYLHSVFRDNVLVISPITEKDGVFENTNSDDIFMELYEFGLLHPQLLNFEKGFVYTREGNDKSHLQMPCVEIRYV